MICASAKGESEIFVIFRGKPYFDECCDGKMAVTVTPIFKKLGANPKCCRANGLLTPVYFHRWYQLRYYMILKTIVDILRCTAFASKYNTIF